MLHRVLELPVLIATKEYRFTAKVPLHSYVSTALCITNVLSDYRLTIYCMSLCPSVLVVTIEEADCSSGLPPPLESN